MPIYEYQCPGCKERFEKLVRASNTSPEVDCPSCGTPGARRLISSFASFSVGGTSSASSSCAPSGG